ncbi:MAG: hypothetical protein JY451_09015 [Erythrobacter sp.]|nr:MAG: hypothetical protein JY451_09015 [Erythrobacter sp.]
MEWKSGREAPGSAIEFAATDAEEALFRAQRNCDGRAIELFEDGRPLASLSSAASGGFWILAPSLKQSDAA